MKAVKGEAEALFSKMRVLSKIALAKDDRI
jgi:hypothetical protein